MENARRAAGGAAIGVTGAGRGGGWGAPERGGDCGVTERAAGC